MRKKARRKRVNELAMTQEREKENKKNLLVVARNSALLVVVR